MLYGEDKWMIHMNLDRLWFRSSDAPQAHRYCRREIASKNKEREPWRIRAKTAA